MLAIDDDDDNNRWEPPGFLPALPAGRGECAAWVNAGAGAPIATLNAQLLQSCVQTLVAIDSKT